MKKFGSFLALILLSSSGFTALHECTSVSANSDSWSFILALDNNDSGLVFKKNPGDPVKNWHELIDGITTVTRDVDGGPTRVSVSPIDRDVDWDKEDNCWVRIGASYDFNLHAQGSEVMLFGVIKVNPAVEECEVPNFQRRIEELNCQLK